MMDEKASTCSEDKSCDRENTSLFTRGLYVGILQIILNLNISSRGRIVQA